jgi:Kdo2-lipid IVA lauroyltransferase/acyltransferase
MNRLILPSFYFLSAFSYLISLLPDRLRNGLAALMYFKIYHLVGYRRKIVRENLKAAFPEKSTEERLKIEQRFYKHFCRLLLEINAGQSISEKKIRERFLFKNLDVLNQFLEKGKSVALVFGHYGNWEWTVSLPLVLSFPVLAIYQPLTNPFMDKKMIKVRSRFGLTPVPMHQIYKELYQRQKEGQATVTYFAADQSPNRSQIKEWFTFLNQPTGVFQGTERIAKKLNQAVVYLKVNPVKPGYYEADFEVLAENAESCSENEITLKHLAVLEEMIRLKPEYWLWTHKRWKHKPLKNAVNELKE